eukprot:2312279-Amphidinium_carterae.1
MCPLSLPKSGSSGALRLMPFVSTVGHVGLHTGRICFNYHAFKGRPRVSLKRKTRAKLSLGFEGDNSVEAVHRVGVAPACRNRLEVLPLWSGKIFPNTAVQNLMFFSSIVLVQLGAFVRGGHVAQQQQVLTNTGDDSEIVTSQRYSLARAHRLGKYQSRLRTVMWVPLNDCAASEVSHQSGLLPIL